MHYRFVQIAEIYLGYVSYGGDPTTKSCYFVGRDKFKTPEEAHRAIQLLCTGDYPNVVKLEEDWFIVIQCF
jgi:hypothetical protein